MSMGINVHLNPDEVRIVNSLITQLRKDNPEFKKVWDENATTKKLVARLMKANTNIAHYNELRFRGEA